MNRIRVVMKWLSEVKRGESGQVLPVVLIMMALGGLLIVPSLDYVSTSLNAGEIVEEKVEGLYAAEAGVEDALWKLKYGEELTFPYSYQLTGINGMSVSVVIDETTTVVGREIGSTGGDADYLDVTRTVTYDAGIYYYTMQLANVGNGNIKIELILIDFPPGIGYVEGSTGGDLTTTGEDPSVVGDPTTGITLVWEWVPPTSIPTIPEGEMAEHTFRLSGPEGIEGAEGHGCVRATRQDVGTVWEADIRPYSIVAEARDATGTLVTTVRAGVWDGDPLEISGWQVNP